MNDGHPHLAENSDRQVSWSLGRHAHGKAVLPALLGDRVEGVEARVGELVSDGDIEELVGLIDRDHQRDGSELVVASSLKQCPTDDVDHDLAEVVSERQVPE